MKVEVDVLGSPSLIVRTVSVDVKQHLKKKPRECWNGRAVGHLRDEGVKRMDG